MRQLLVRSLVCFLVIITSILAPASTTATPVSAAVQTLHSFYFSGNTPPFQDSYISVTRTLALNSFNAVTLEAWVKRQDASRTEMVVCNDPAFSYCLGFSGGQVFFDTNGTNAQLLSNSTVGANYWVHIAGTYANGVSQIYINGILDASAPNSWGIGPSITGSFGIGADLTQANPQSYFKGWIDNVRLWNVARSGSDIRATLFQELGGSASNLVSEWRLNGDATDAVGSNNGTAVGPDYITDGALPHDLRIPLVGSAPTLDGSCGASTEYNTAVQISDSSTQPPGTSIYLERTASDLWVCFDQLTPPTGGGDNWAAVYLDPNFSRDTLSQADDFSLEMHHDGSRRTRAGNASGDYNITNAYDSQWAGVYASTFDGFLTHYFAEFRISNALIGATTHSKTIGLAVAQHWISGVGDDRDWPALVGYNSPASWSAATLNGTGPSRTFNGHIMYNPQGSNTYTGISGINVQIVGRDPNTTEAITATTKTLADGSFSLTTNDDYPQHRLEIDPNTFPQGYMPYTASTSLVGVVYDATTINFNNLGGGTYAGLLFTITDVRPGLVDQSNAPYFLIVAPQVTIDKGALNDFVDYKKRIGFKVEVASIEDAIANYNGANTMQHIRSLEVNRYFLYGPRFGYVMLVGSDQTLPFGRIDAGTVLPNDCKLPGAGWPTDWFYADLTSNWDTNGNGCYGDGIFGDASQEAKNGYTPDSKDVYHLTVAVGRLPFDDPNVVRTVLSNSMTFEKSSQDIKRQALLSMSMMGLNNQCWDTKQNKYNTCNDGTDGAYLGQAMIQDILTPNTLQTYRLYENQPVVVGGVATGASGVMTTLQDTYDNLKAQLSTSNPAYGLVSTQGHGWKEGVVRTYWAGDANNNNRIDNPTAPFPPNNQSVYEVQQPEMFDTGSLKSRPGQGPVFLLAACSTGEFDDPNSLGAALLSNNQGTAWVGGTGVVPYSGGWQNPGNGGMQSINYNVAYRMLNYNQRLGDAVWDTMNIYMIAAKQHPEQGWWAQDYDLYGDPTLSYWGNPGGQSTLSPWPMLRADPYGHGATTLMGPSGTPISAWTYPSLARVLDTLPPSPVVTSKGDAVIAQGNFVDLVRDGFQQTRLTLNAPDYGSPAIAADGTIYALDRGGILYAFWCGSGTTCSYALHWKLDLGSHPLTSPVIGPDGLVAIGHEGADPAHSLIALVRSDGFLYDDQPIDGQPVGELAVGGDRVVYATTDAGSLVEFDYTCHNGFCIKYEPAQGAAYTTPPLLYLDTIFAGRADGSVEAKNAATLATLHTFQANGAVVSGPIVAPGGSIVVGTDAGTLYALSTGMSERWHATLGAALVSEPASSASDVYIASGNYLYAYEPFSGSLDWLAYLGAGANGGSAAVSYGRQVLVQTRNGPLVDIADDWTPPNPWLLASPAIRVDPAGGSGIKTMSLSWALPVVPGTPGLTPNASSLGTLIQRRVNAQAWQDLVILPPGTSTYNDDSVVDGTLYDYRIQVLDAQGKDSEFTEIADPVQSLPVTPSAPGLNAISPQSAESLKLTWTPVGTGTATSFRIERGPATAGPFTPVTMVTGATLSYIDPGLAANTPYAYRVIAINASGESGPSNIQIGTTFQQTLPAPQNVQATLVDPYHIQVSWTPGPAGTTAVIEMNILGQSGFQVVGTTNNTGPFTDFEENPNSYAYRVKFVKGANESPYGGVTLRKSTAGFQLSFHYLYLPEINH